MRHKKVNGAEAADDQALRAQCYLGGDATVHQVLQQLLVPMSQHVLHHAQDVERRVGEVLEPVLTPVHWQNKPQSRGCTFGYLNNVIL